MLQDFNSVFQFTITPSEIIANVFVAFISGIIISFFYRKTYSGPGYLASFLNSMILLSIITSIVIMVIGNNLARAFGLVGAMSIIRFRTAVKETQDIIYIFFSLAIGMAAGVGLHILAIAGTLFVGTVSLILTKTNFTTPSKKDFLLLLTVASNGNNSKSEYKRVINKYCKSQKLINAKSIGDGDIMELSYHVGFRNRMENTDFLSELKSLKDVQHVNLYFDEEYF